VSNEAIREKIVLNNDIGREATQMLLEGELVVPDVKPDIAQLLKTDAEVSFDRTEVMAGRVHFTGKLQMRALYAARGAEPAVHSVALDVPLDDSINMDGLEREAWVGLKGRLADVEFSVLNDRKLGYRAVLDVEAHAEAFAEHDVVTAIAGLPDNRLKHTTLDVSRTVECKDSRIALRDELPIPPGKPNVREILQTSAAIANKESKVASGRVHIGGELVVTTLYRGDAEDSLLEFVEHEVPFSGAIDVADAREGMFADVTLHVASQSVQAKADADGEDRVLAADIIIGAAVKVMNQSEIAILEDAYCVGKQLELTRAAVRFPQFICRNKSQCTVKELVQLPEGLPAMLQICRVTGEAVLDSVELAADRATVSGIVKADVLYIAKGDMPLCHYETVLPFVQAIDARNALPDMEALVEQSIEHIGFNMLAENEVELRFVVGLGLVVTERAEASVITDIAFIDIAKNVLDQMPGMVVYVVQKGDTLWSIAKRYNADLEELIALNEIETPDLIFPGQKLIVLKKASE